MNELKEWVSDILSFTNLKRRGIFDPSAVRRLLQRILKVRLMLLILYCP